MLYVGLVLASAAVTLAGLAVGYGGMRLGEAVGQLLLDLAAGREAVARRLRAAARWLDSEGE